MRLSRYSRLKNELNKAEFNNGSWVEIDIDAVSDDYSPFTYVDLFSGAGGMSVGASSAGLRKLLSVDIDPDASRTICSNFPYSAHWAMPIELITTDMLTSIIDDMPVNVVFGGPPCQGFSAAGYRNPEDARNQLFREYIRIVAILNPDYVVMENVPGILTIEKGNIRNAIIDQFAYIGYTGVSVRILESAAFGVPQLRPRVIFIANRHGLPNPYPREILNESEYRTIESAIDDLKILGRNQMPNHEWTNHSAEFEYRLSQIKAGESLYSSFRDAFKRQYRDKPSMTVKENHGGCHIHYELNRVISAREMARLQTFPDDFIFSGRFKRVYWQIGNAVPCLLSYCIALSIRHQLEFYI